MERVRYDLMLVINTPTFAVICNSTVWALLLCVPAHRHRIPFLGIQPSNVPSSGSLEQIAYIRRTLTQYSSEFSTKDLRRWAETLSGSASEDEAFVIGSTIDDSAGEDEIPNF